MPPKNSRGTVINIKNDDLQLYCEWEGCELSFQSMDPFMAHVTEHLNHHFGSEHSTTEEDQDYHCLWRECGAEIEGGPSGFVRHVYFHTFHVKIKCIGAVLVEKTGQRACTLVTQSSRNLIPELPEKLVCGWEHCHLMFENAELFYRHVENHGDSFPEGNHVRNGCKCGWEGCEVKVKSKHKLKDHLRSHTQEKLVACPTCGALFSSRTKFYDHLKRQLPTYTGKRYQCSHCNRTFASERLLRDHMRNHVNQYKCPYCDMTCPSPSCLRLHIRYRHSDEKPFKCDHCDHSCKTQADLKKHMDTHNEDSLYHCQMGGCKYSARGYQSLINHYKYNHQSSKYECHVCRGTFKRGTMLTRHLKHVHDFSWPSGHSRFRYKLHSDGMWRLQTVRYETIQLTTHNGDTVIQPRPETHSNENTVKQEPITDEAAHSLETFDALSEKTDLVIDTCEDITVAFALDDSQNTQEKETVKCVKSQSSLESVKHKQTRVLSDSSNWEMGSNEGEEMVKISLTLDKDGKCLLQTENQPLSEALSMSLADNEELEENMYNLQMLGEVALQKESKL